MNGGIQSQNRKFKMEGVQVKQLVNSLPDDLGDLDDVKETKDHSSNQDVEDGIIRAQRNK